MKRTARRHYGRALILLTAVSGLPILGQAHSVQAAVISAQARILYNQGMTLKATNRAESLADFKKAALLAPNWEAPVYQEGVLLSVMNFPEAIPVLEHAARLNPSDDTVWNIMGWGYYVRKDYTDAEAAFRKQLGIHPHSPNALWGLANCYGNSQVRAYAEARTYLQSLSLVPQFHPSAAKMLASLPPDVLDATEHAGAPIRYEDAIGMLLTYRSDIGLSTRCAFTAADGKPADPNLQPYVAYAVQRNLLRGLTIPSFQAPASRLFIALLLARYYGLNAYDYVRPFPLTDMSDFSSGETMTVNSVLAEGLLKTIGTHQFQPNGWMSRSLFMKTVVSANTIMKHPPSVSQWATPAPPPIQHHPTVYFFTTSQPDVQTRNADIAKHATTLTDVGFTSFPLIPDARSGAALKIAAQAGTRYIVPTLTPGSDQAKELAQVVTHGVHPFLVLGNYNQNTNASDPAIVHRWLSSDTDRASLAQEVVRLTRAYHLSGITVDFENMDAKDRQNYVKFVAQVRTALTGTPNIPLMVCLPERDQDNPNSPYDYAGLAKSADLVMLITYDEHSAGSKPGPISQLPNDDRVVKYALTQMPADKILLGVADYGYDWSATGGVEVSMAQAQRLATQHHATIHLDALSDTPSYVYQDSNGKQHTVWYTDSESIAAELGLVNQYGLAGVSVWHLGADDADFWSAMQTVFGS